MQGMMSMSQYRIVVLTCVTSYFGMIIITTLLIIKLVRDTTVVIHLEKERQERKYNYFYVGLHRILNWPDIRRPDIRYPAGYPVWPDIRYPAGYPAAGYPVSGRISGLAGYPVSGLIVKGFHKKTKQLTFFSITFTVFNILL